MLKLKIMNNKYKIRLFLYSLVIILITIIQLDNFINIVTMPYDGNRYETPSSQIYIRKDIICEKSNHLENQDTIKLGNILLSINNIEFYSYKELFNEIEQCNLTDTLQITYIDVETNKIHTQNVLVHNLQENTFKFLNSMALVLNVDEGGVAEKAGLQIGDIIVRLDGEEFGNDKNLHRKTVEKGAGEFLNLEIIRKNEYKSIKIEIVKYGIKLTVLYAYILLFLLISLGSFFIFKKPLNNYSVLTGFSLIFFSILFIENNSVYNQFSDIESIYITLSRILKIILLNITVPFILISIFHFPNQNPNPMFFRKFIKWSVILKSISILIFLSILFELVNLQILSLITFTTDIFLIFYFWGLKIKYRKNELKILDKKSKLIQFTYFIYFILFITDAVFVILYNSINNTTTSLGLSFWGVIIIPISFIISLFKYKPYDIILKIKRNIQYLFLLYIWKLCLVLITIMFLYFISVPDFFIPNLHFSGQTIEVLGRPLSDERYKMYSKILVLFIFAIYFGIFRKINRIIQNYLDIKYNKVKLDYKLTSEELNQLFINNPDIDNLSKEFLNKITKYLQINHSSLIIFDENNIKVQHYIGINDNILRQYVVSINQLLIENAKRIDKIGEVKNLDYDLKQLFEQCNLKLIIPIKTDKNLIGILILGDKRSEDKFNKEELKYIESITNQISFAIEKAFLSSKIEDGKRIQQELEFARKIQLNSLPQKQPTIKNLDLTALSIPALEVGGDFYDYLYKSDDEITLVIGDVSGKGTSAALYMSKVQGIIRTLYQFDLSPKEILIKTNQLISENINKGSFISSSIVQINSLTGECNYARAGHLPLYLYKSKEQQIEKLVPKGLVLGMGKLDLFNNNLEEMKFNICENDIILLVTDGIIEARNNKNEEFDEDKLLKVFEENVNNDVNEIRHNLIQSIQNFSQNVNQFDDLTVLIVRYNQLQNNQ